MKEFLIDTDLRASFRVKANSEAEAIVKLREVVHCAGGNFGELGGEPLIAEVTCHKAWVVEENEED